MRLPVQLWLGGALTLVFLGAALLSFLWTPYNVETLTIADKLAEPSAKYWLGTDHFGRDILSMLMVGARTSIAVAIVAVGIGILIGVPLGLTAAANRGGWLDEIIMRGNDLIFAFPSLVIAILITVLAIAALFLGAEGNDVSPAVFFILGTVALVALGGPEMVKFLRSKV